MGARGGRSTAGHAHEEEEDRPSDARGYTRPGAAGTDDERAIDVRCSGSDSPFRFRVVVLFRSASNASIIVLCFPAAILLPRPEKRKLQI